MEIYAFYTDSNNFRFSTIFGIYGKINTTYEKSTTFYED